MSAELLPCPFCGGAANLKRGKTVMVSCSACTASTFQVLSDSKSAIAAWNRRAALASQGVAVPAGWREFIENIATPYSEPLNSISGYRSKDERKIAMGALRATAQKLIAAAPQPPAVKEAAPAPATLRDGVEYGQCARAVLAAAGNSQGLDGWKLVPIHLTEAMHVAAVRTIQRCTGNDDFPGRVYAAMLAAAPVGGRQP